MHNYKLLEDNETLLVNTCFFDEEDAEYAFKHRFNIKYTEVRNTGFAEDTMLLQKLGYKFNLETEPDVAPDGTKLKDKIYAYYTHPENIISNDVYNIENDERKIITEVLNYLICLSRLVSSNDASKHFGFNFDGAIIDTFRAIKNDFQYNMLKPNVQKILNDSIYKQIVNELNEWEDNYNG